MKDFVYTLRDEAGIHARPAGMIVKMSKESGCSVTIEKGDKKADGSKLFSVMSLGVKKGDTIKITVSGENEEATFGELLNFFTENL